MQEIAEREPVKRGRMVNRVFGDPAEQLRERHDASDFETQTWDKIGDDPGIVLEFSSFTIRLRSSSTEGNPMIRIAVRPWP